jgi:hypothetical protein
LDWNSFGILKLDWELKLKIYGIGLEFGVGKKLIFNLDLDFN